MATINQQIDYDTAAIVVEEMGFDPQPVILVPEETETTKAPLSGGALRRRRPAQARTPSARGYHFRARRSW